MQLTVTERDKKLLVVLAVFLLVIGLGAGVVLPLMNKGQKLSEKLTNEKMAKEEMELKIQTLPALEKKAEDMESNLAEESKHFYSLMGSAEIDKMLTESLMAKGVTVKDLDIVMPQENDYTTLKDYNITQTDFLGQTSDTQTSGESDEKSGTNYDGIYTANVNLMLAGTSEQLQTAINDFAAEEPRVRITNFTWGANRNNDSANESLSISLELYMTQNTNKATE